MKTNKTETEKYLEKSNDWESSQAEQMIRSEKRAWWVAGALAIVCVLQAIGIFQMLPLKETQPFIYRTNTDTGVPEVITRLDTEDITFTEAMDKYWVANYVKRREQYDWYTVQSDYDFVGALSEAVVSTDYARRFNGEAALHKQLGENYKLEVDVLSVVPEKGKATVRFRRKKTRPGYGSEKSTVWIATVIYEYKKTTQLNEADRLINPFGFRVTSYRLDPEIVVE